MHREKLGGCLSSAQAGASRAASLIGLHRKVTLLYTICPNYSRNEPPAAANGGSTEPCAAAARTRTASFALTLHALAVAPVLRRTWSSPGSTKSEVSARFPSNP